LGLFYFSKEIFMSHLMSNYLPLDVTFSSGEGCWLTDDKGQQYLDCLSGVGVVNLGHCHPAITQAIVEQASTLLHTSNWYRIENQELLAERLCSVANMDKVFFGNSGAEANEAAIKIARLHGQSKGIKNPIILTANQSFHGRTMATLSATGNSKVQAGFAPLVSEFIHVDFNDIDAIKAFDGHASVVAVMLEPIQGESGVIIPDDDYLNNVQTICNNNDWLLILDEVQTGVGRTGEFFCSPTQQHHTRCNDPCKRTGQWHPDWCMPNKRCGKRTVDARHPWFNVWWQSTGNKGRPEYFGCI